LINDYICTPTIIYENNNASIEDLKSSNAGVVLKINYRRKYLFVGGLSFVTAPGVT